MIRSMTGYGNARREGAGLQVQVDLRSVNNRFFDFQPRLPRELGFLEGEILKRCNGSDSVATIVASVPTTRTCRARSSMSYTQAAMAKKVAYPKITIRGTNGQFHHQYSQWK